MLGLPAIAWLDQLLHGADQREHVRPLGSLAIANRVSAVVHPRR
jgi:hypothetical protein